jgi:hypothetical protein
LLALPADDFAQGKDNEKRFAKELAAISRWFGTIDRKRSVCLR